MSQYIKKLKKNFPHGIMFHHFHDNLVHKKGQGTINKNQFRKILTFVGRDNILNANDFFDLNKKKKLKKNHLCLTFDDCNLSQYDIALPVLEEFQIKAFFFVTTSVYEGNFDKTQVYRFFRTNYFKNINNFYKNFYNYVSPSYLNFLKKKSKEISFKKKIYPHYSFDDIKFRLIRNEYLKEKKYDIVMKKMFQKFGFNLNKYKNKIFISSNNIQNIQKKGHMIGLHSHSHPVNMNCLSYNKQLNEYKKNKKILEKFIKKNNVLVRSMSHPCGRYNHNTLKILKKLNIEIGFIERMNKFKKNKDYIFKIPRQDHADILTMLKK